MKSKLAFNKYWIIIALVIFINLFIFKFFSNSLENYVEGSMSIKKDLINEY